jgi:hypothetical protein
MTVDQIYQLATSLSTWGPLAILLIVIVLVRSKSKFKFSGEVHFGGDDKPDDTK